jgi:hypothetical protein
VDIDRLLAKVEELSSGPAPVGTGRRRHAVLGAS